MGGDMDSVEYRLAKRKLRFLAGDEDYALEALEAVSSAATRRIKRSKYRVYIGGFKWHSGPTWEAAFDSLEREMNHAEITGAPV
jgi:hypothetical protein